MTDSISSLRVSLKDGVIEITGSEEFVQKNIITPNKILEQHTNLAKLEMLELLKKQLEEQINYINELIVVTESQISENQEKMKKYQKKIRDCEESLKNIIEQINNI